MTEVSLFERVAAAVEGIRGQVATNPTVGLILGGGADAGRYFARRAAVGLDSLLGAPEGGGTHGELIFGELGGTPTVVLAGRAGGGTPLREATLPVRVARQLGASALIVAGRAEVLNPKWEKSRLMLIVDHINLLGANPLVGPNDERLGPRFPDMTQAYDSNFRRIAEDSAKERGIQLVRGVYIGRAGPTASADEARLLSSFGGDAVGQGIVAEVITAVHSGMRVLGLAALEARGAGVGSSASGSGIGSSALEIIAAVVQRR